MSTVSAAAYRAAFGAVRGSCALLAAWLLVSLCGCATELAKSPPLRPAVAPMAAQPAVPGKPINPSRQPAHPIPYAQMPNPVKPPEGAPPTVAGQPYTPFPDALRGSQSPPPLSASALPPAATLRPLTSLPGWDREDHLAALKAFRDGCGVAKAAEWRLVCTRARAVMPLDEASARAFFETGFMAEARAPTGMLTAYFAPEYPASATPDAVFSAPVRPRPDETDDEAGRPRAEIEAQPADGVQAYMKAEDLFFLQVQGSGTLVFPDGHKLKAIYAADNGLPFIAIARPMLQAGLLSASNLSGDTIRTWLSDHRGPEANAVMDKDPRYIFFDLAPDDGQEPAGAAGQPLTAGRALAVDPSFHKYGALYWIDADAPTLNGAVPAYRRLALALDTGAAIRGERRADLYLGRGDAAGREAGRVRHVLSLVRLIPVTSPIPAAPSHETPP